MPARFQPAPGLRAGPLALALAGVAVVAAIWYSKKEAVLATGKE